MPTPAPRRLLIVRFSALGEVILTSAAVAAIKEAEPDLAIHFATKEIYAELLRPDPRLAGVHGFSAGASLWSFGRRLRAVRPDAILDLHDKLRSRLVAGFLPRIRRVVWHKRDWRHGLPVRLGLRPYRADKWVTERFVQAAETLARRPLSRPPVQIFVSADSRERAASLLFHNRLDPAAAIVGLAPGAVWATKRWPVDGFATVAERAVAAGHAVLIFGSAGERPLGDLIQSQVPQAVNLAGATDLALLAGLVSRCDLFVANDSGPMHLARALGVPTVAIFGSTDPGQFDFSGHRVLFAGVPCAPCHFYGRRACPRQHFDCMRKITPDAVWQAMLELLGSAPAALVRG